MTPLLTAVTPLPIIEFAFIFEVAVICGSQLPNLSLTSALNVYSDKLITCSVKLQASQYTLSTLKSIGSLTHPLSVSQLVQFDVSCSLHFPIHFYTFSNNLRSVVIIVRPFSALYCLFIGLSSCFFLKLLLCGCFSCFVIFVM